MWFVGWNKEVKRLKCWVTKMGIEKCCNNFHSMLINGARFFYCSNYFTYLVMFYWAHFWHILKWRGDNWSFQVSIDISSVESFRCTPVIIILAELVFRNPSYCMRLEHPWMIQWQTLAENSPQVFKKEYFYVFLIQHLCCMVGWFLTGLWKCGNETALTYLPHIRREYVMEIKWPGHCHYSCLGNLVFLVIPSGYNNLRCQYCCINNVWIGQNCTDIFTAST